MLDLDNLVNRVVNPDIRPLVKEAHRCYATGAARAAIVLTWTAVCADLIYKIEVLKEEGEADARGLVQDVERAQQPGETNAIPLMLTVENTIVDIAEKPAEQRVEVAVAGGRFDGGPSGRVKT